MVKFARRKPSMRRKPVTRRKPAVRRKAGRRKYPRKSRQVIQANLGGLSLTKFSLGRRPSPQVSTLKKTGSPNFLNLSYSWSNQADGGTQGLTEAFMCARNDLQRIWATIQSKNIVVSPNLITYPSGATNPSWRYILEHMTQTLHFSNTGPTPVNVELYDIVARRNGPVNPIDLSGVPLQAGGKAQEMSPILAWGLGALPGSSQSTEATGFTDANLWKDTDVTPTNLGASPTNSDMFNRFFKVVRRSNLTLPIGGQHKHVVNLSPNRIFKQSEMAESSTFSNVSVFTLVVHQGVPVVGCNTGGIPLVTTSSSQLSFVQTLRYKWTFTQDAQVNTYVASYLPSSAREYQSIQPSLVKVNDVTNIATITPTAIQYVSLPSECTR